MKRLITLFLIGIVFTTSIWSKTLVAFFSQTGRTRTIAERTAKLLNADLFEIVPEKPYVSAELSLENLKSRAKLEAGDPKSRPSIKNKIDISEYSTVILAYPIWFESAPKIMFTFVEENDLSGKTVIPICTSTTAGISTSTKELSKAASPKANFKKGKAFKTDPTDEEIMNFFKKRL